MLVFDRFPRGRIDLSKNGRRTFAHALEHGDAGVPHHPEQNLVLEDDEGLFVAQGRGAFAAELLRHGLDLGGDLRRHERDGDAVVETFFGDVSLRHSEIRRRHTPQGGAERRTSCLIAA
jgi:hypothetical protein